MKVLTVMSTIFLPLTVLTGMWGMNVPLPHLPGRRRARSSGGSAGIMVGRSSRLVDARSVFRAEQTGSDASRDS